MSLYLAYVLRRFQVAPSGWNTVSPESCLAAWKKWCDAPRPLSSHLQNGRDDVLLWLRLTLLLTLWACVLHGAWCGECSVDVNLTLLEINI